MSRLKTSTTVYVDNMSFYTAEEQVHYFFSQVRPVKIDTQQQNRQLNPSPQPPPPPTLRSGW